MPNLEENNEKLVKFLEYLEKTWIKETATFPRVIWNFHNSISNRSNNISETYNKKINLEIEKPTPNIYRLINIIQDQEILTAISFEKANLVKKKQGKQRKI